MTTGDLFDSIASPLPATERIASGALLLRGFALAHAPALLDALEHVTTTAPFRHLVTPGGFTMSVAITNCGALGWTSDRKGYRYTCSDPLSDQPWPPLPTVFSWLANAAAAAAGYPDFTPDAALINRYLPGTKMSL